MCKELVRELQSCPDAEYGCSRCEFQKTLNCREHLMKKAARAIEELVGKVEQLPHWIPMTEHLPKEELCFYSCYTDKGVVVECLWTNNKYGLGPLGEWGWRLMDVPPHQYITHWQPLPEPPKEET